jgi:predicted SprT family Zn-dependent metalloprotease
MPRDHHFTLHGLRWLVRFTRLRGQAAGWAYLPDAKRPSMPRKILIDERLKNRTLLETIVHECIHVSFPSASEDHVTESARDIARVLWTLGYRLDEDKAP